MVEVQGRTARASRSGARLSRMRSCCHGRHVHRHWPPAPRERALEGRRQFEGQGGQAGGLASPERNVSVRPGRRSPANPWQPLVPRTDDEPERNADMNALVEKNPRRAHSRVPGRPRGVAEAVPSHPAAGGLSGHVPASSPPGPAEPVAGRQDPGNAPHRSGRERRRRSGRAGRRPSRLRRHAAPSRPGTGGHGRRASRRPPRLRRLPPPSRPGTRRRRRRGSPWTTRPMSRRGQAGQHS